MDIKIFFEYFKKYAYKKYLWILVALLFLRYALGVVFFNKEIIFSIILALLIYDLPFYLNFKHWETNKVIRYRDLIEIFTSIFSTLCKSYNIEIKLATNVGYYTSEYIKEITDKLDNSAMNKEYVNFNLVQLCNKDFQTLQHIHASYFEEFCCDEVLKDFFLLMVGNITKMDRDVDLILNLNDNSQQLNCIDNFHLQVRNICDEVNIFYSDFFNEVNQNIPITKNSYMKQIMGID